MKYNKINEKILDEAEKQHKEGILDETEFKKAYNLNQQSFDLITYFLSKNFDQISTVLSKNLIDIIDDNISRSEVKFITSQTDIIMKKIFKELKSQS